MIPTLPPISQCFLQLGSIRLRRCAPAKMSWGGLKTQLAIVRCHSEHVMDCIDYFIFPLWSHFPFSHESCPLPNSWNSLEYEKSNSRGIIPGHPFFLNPPNNVRVNVWEFWQLQIQTGVAALLRINGRQAAEYKFNTFSSNVVMHLQLD